MQQENKNISRGVFHFHSEYSFDSLSSIQAIADRLENLNLDFAVLTDHDDVKGSIRLREELARRGSQIWVPVAAEYSSEVGDIIVVGVEDDLSGLPVYEIIKVARQRGGITILPHPYDAHKLCDDWVSEVDAIEVFNGRSSDANNSKSQCLAKRLSKPRIYSADAHLLRNLGNVIISKPESMSFQDALQNDFISVVHKRSSPRSDITLSQIIKSYKTRNIRLFIRIISSSGINLLRHRFPRIFNYLKEVTKKK